VSAMLGVEQDNPAARRLYEKLGYTPCGTEEESWVETGPDGKPFTYRTTVTLLEKKLH
jgi:RimJ/RimL family protein N-acetyltransferase